MGQLTHLGVSHANSCNGFRRQSRIEFNMTREISSTSKRGSGAVEDDHIVGYMEYQVRKKIATYSEILNQIQWKT